MKDVIAVLKLEGDLRYFSSNEGPRPDATSWGSMDLGCPVKRRT
jgi:hypothetical protein